MKRIRQKQKNKFNKYLQRHLANEYRRIILQIRLLETKMQELRLDQIIGNKDVGVDRLSQKFAKDMQNEFEMSLLGEISFFLGLQICQRNQGIFISQTKYIKEMLKRSGMKDCKPVITPMQSSCKLSKDDDSKSTDQRQYRSMVGILLYVTTSRLDVMQAVGQVAQFKATPKESHVLAVKRIFRYLKGT
jgi:hypothetical protein